jgi:multidrug efflux pump subunit AcrB
MIASYFVSMAVTPVACHYFLGHAEPSGLWKKLERAIDRLAATYAEALRQVLPHRLLVLFCASLLVLVSGFVASRLPSTFFPEIDESMECIYVRLAPGSSIRESGALLDKMGRTLTAELPAGSVELVLTNVGSPNNARSALSSPNWGPHMGFIRLALAPPEARRLSQRELADRSRAILNRHFPGVEFLQFPGGLVASVFANGFGAPLAIELRGDKLEAIEQQAHDVAEVMRTVPGVRDIRVTLQMNYPEIRIEVDRSRAGLVEVSARDIGQATLEATLGNINTPSVWVDPNNGQSYYVVTSYDNSRISDQNALNHLPVRASGEGHAVALGAYSDIRRSAGPIAIERNQLQRAVHVLAQVEGRDLGTVAADLAKALARDVRTAHLHTDFVGQVGLMRTTFGGLGLALGLAVMVVFMIMASQFQSLRLPFVMLFTIPVALVGIVTALMAAGQGFSITALMGVLMVIGIAVSNGILLVDDAARRLEEGVTPMESIVQAARSRFVPIMMTSLATVIGLIPTSLGLEHGSEANQPLALAVVGGLSSSTLLSLFLVPVMYLLLVKHRGNPVEAELARTEGHA